MGPEWIDEIRVGIVIAVPRLAYQMPLPFFPAVKLVNRRAAALTV